jgi:hypothetical protein
MCKKYYDCQLLKNVENVETMAHQILLICTRTFRSTGD